MKPHLFIHVALGRIGPDTARERRGAGYRMAIIGSTRIARRAGT
jgi:hypothetical protein